MANENQLTSQMSEISRNIPDEMMFEEILVRLPVKSLTIYKSVCKLWLHKIESRSFNDTYRRRHNRDYSDQIMFSRFKSVSDPITKSSFLLPSTHSFGPGLIKMTPRPLDVMLPPEMTRLNWPDVDLDELDELDERIGIEIELGTRYWRASVIALGPARTTGIYCVVAYLLRDPLCTWARQPVPNAKISICNPATRDHKLANPFPPEEMARLLDLTATQYCNVRYGFGLAADGDYKVVVVITWFPTCKTFLSYVYSLKQGAWNKIADSECGMVSRLDLRGKPDFPELLDLSELCPQAFVNSCWHWIAMSSDSTFNVLCFDVDEEEFKLMYGPPCYRGHAITGADIFTARVNKSRVTVLNDHLALLYNIYSHAPSDHSRVISVWMMMEYGDEESWINIWRVDLESGPMTTPVGILYSLREDGDGGIHIDRIVFEGSEKQLVSCDEFGVVEEQPGFDTSSCVFWNILGISAYSETLERL